MDQLGSTLASLLNQSRQPDRVILNIPRTYRRENFTYANLPRVPDGVEIIITDVDCGPATKLFPTIRQFKGENVNIVFCDDDRLYPVNWLSNLVENALRHPGECITVAAGLISQIEAYYHYVNRPNPAFLAPLYRKIYAFKKRRPEPSRTADIACGYGGVLVRPEFFDEKVFSIPQDVSL
jgi:GT2 family glycosyltransferase